MGASVKHLIALRREENPEPEWAKELKEILARLVDLAARVLSADGKTPALEHVLTPKELADRLKLPESTVLEMARSGKLPAFRLGKHWRFDLDVLRKTLNMNGEL